MDSINEYCFLPKLRFKHFEEKYSTRKVCEVSVINPKHQHLPEEFVYINLECVKKGILLKENVINKSFAPSRAQRVLENGDILYQSVRPYQKNNYLFELEGNYVASTGYLQVKTHINNKYLFQYFHNNKFVNKVLKMCTGANYPTINSDDFGNIKLNLPSLAEQQKIALFLSAVDDKLKQLIKKKELLEEYKKGVMQKIFSQELRFKDANGNNYPDWKEKKLGDIGKTFNGLTGKSKVDFGTGKPFIEYLQVANSSKINVSGCGKVLIKEDEKQNKIIYGDIFFTTSSEDTDVGLASVLLDNVDEMYLNSFCFGYRIDSFNVLHPEFASYLLRNQKLRKQIKKLAQGSTRYNMSKVQLMKERVTLPSIKEQKKIANFLSSLDGKIELVSTQIEKTKAFKKGLLQQMFV